MHVRRLWVRVAIACLGIAGCSGRSGILLEVTTQDEGLRVDRLDFVVSPEVITPEHAPRFVRDHLSSVTVDVAGRDLIADPYRLFLTDARGAGADSPLLAAVLGYRDGDDRPVAFGALPPRQFVSGEVLLHTIVLEARTDVAPTTTGCVRWSEGESVHPEDRDCDGVRPPDDCDDLDPLINPRRGELCDNGKDDDCDGAIDEPEDRDRDGVDQCDDCDDEQPAVFPGAPGFCDGLDNDCNGSCDESYDLDRDGVSSCGTVPGEGLTCGPAATPDCRDDDPTVGPKQTDRCDGRDDDCDGRCDSSDQHDDDGDGFTACGTLAAISAFPGETCGATSPLLADCDDDDGGVHPFEHELCNGRDDSCDGIGLESAPCFVSDSSGCALGRAGCDDDDRDGSAGLGACVADAPRVPVDDPLCAAYDDCDEDPDAFRCAVFDAATWRVDCELFVRRLPSDPTRPARFEVCPGASTELPQVADVAGCLWQLVGGLDQEQLTVGLALTRFGPTSAQLASCAGRFVVTALASNLAFEPDTIVVLYGDLGRPQGRAARVRVRPRLVAAGGTCPASPLVCDIVTP